MRSTLGARLRPRSRRSRALLAGLAATSLVAVAAATVEAAAPPVGQKASADRTSAPQAVIVVLRDQHGKTPAPGSARAARAAAVRADQAPLLDAMRAAGATHIKPYTLVNAFAATIPAASVAQLRANPAVASVLPDRTIAVPHAQQPSLLDAASAGAPSATTPSVDAPPADAICPSDPSQPLIEPEALQSIHAISSPGHPGAQDLVTGAGVKVAYIADGINPDSPDFIRPDGSHVITDYEDFSGEGPVSPTGGQEAFGDASSIAAQGTVVHDLSQFVNQAHPLPPGCNIRIIGVAPGASIVALKAGGEGLPNSAILQAIDYAVNVAHVDVLNESFGLNTYPQQTAALDSITQFNDAAVAAGVTVTQSTGDAGITNTIGVGDDPNTIQVAATTDNRLYAQTTYAAFPFSNGKWISDNISSLSSSGVGQGGRTPDLAAPGEGNWAVCQGPPDFGCVNFQSPPQPTDIQSFGGTSESAPLTAGVAALVIQAYRNTHAGANPTPAQVKQYITGTAQDMGLPADEQGSGLLDARAAVEAASATGSHMTAAPNQVLVEDKPGHESRVDVQVTNDGASPETVTANLRTFESVAQDAQQTVQIDHSTDPTFTYYNGTQWAYKTSTFDVPAGTDRLGVAIAWQGAPTVNAGGANPIVRMSLLAPDGTFVANTRPQGGPASANYGFVDVRSPAAGTWTAVFYTPSPSADGPGAAGYTGPVQLEASFGKAVLTPAKTPSVKLAPGETQTVSARVETPASGGDMTEALLLDNGSQTTSVPIVLRPVIKVKQRGAFTGTITGGNARAFSPAQTFTYEFDVPSSTRTLNLNVSTSKLPHSSLQGVLIQPNGEASTISQNLDFDTTGRPHSSAGIQLVQANPWPGRWRFVLIVQNPVSGRDIDLKFSGTIVRSTGRNNVRAIGIPNSPSTTLAAGTPVTAHVLYQNTGATSLLIEADPRLNQTGDVALAPIGNPTATLPGSGGPVFLVPPMTDSLTLSGSATAPVVVELQNAAGAEPDLIGNLPAAQGGATSTAVTDSHATGEVAPGFWFASAGLIGPFPAPAAPQTVTLSASAHTQLFDRAVTSDTGDVWLGAVDPANTDSPAFVPRASVGVITVTITPNQAPGTVVSGTLYVINVPLNTPDPIPQITTGDVLAAIPYSYTVG